MPGRCQVFAGVNGRGITALFVAKDYLYTVSHRLRCHSQCQMREGKKEGKPNLSAGRGRACCEWRCGVPHALQREDAEWVASWPQPGTGGRAQWRRGHGGRGKKSHRCWPLSPLPLTAPTPIDVAVVLKGSALGPVCPGQGIPASGRELSLLAESCGPPGAGDPEAAPSWVMPDEGPKA